MEVLVVHPGALGDVLQAVPALVTLRTLPEEPRLVFSGQPRLAALLVGTGAVDDALAFESLGLETLFAAETLPSEIRSRLAGFARVVSWFGSTADRFAERLRSVVPEALVAPPVPETGPPPTVWEHLVATLEPWGVKAPSWLRPLEVPEEWRADARLVLSRLGSDPGRPLLVVHPGAGGAAKRWPAESYADVIRRVGRETSCQVLVHQGPADREAADQLLRLLDLPALRVLEPSLDRLAGVLREASGYLGADSGVSHLAAAVGAPAVIVFPPATRERWAPWSPTAIPLTAPQDPADVEAVARAVVERLTPAARLTA